MEARYQQELRDRDPATVEDLAFDTFQTTEISGIDDKLVNLQRLSFVGCGLTSLKGLPTLPALTRLDLCDNKLSTGLDIIVKNAPELEELVLSANKFDTLDSIRPLKQSHIRTLDLFDNKITEIEGFRDKVFEIIPTLEVLDGADSAGVEVEGESFDGEDGEDSGDSGDDDGEEDGPGLSYLDNSQLDEDETEDYDPEAKKEARGTKRGAEEAEEEPEAKKVAESDE
ncbi:unnamed protein product [Caenorhabditis auriculariae]|uniref:U2A'/phosphoprotein 32 family A C-terminal domain-containing protein n=1 Tax=Caenorhabditis auriculariae TaxID=2777116 RepID=A0A8S1HQC4_9PELO|nr:unnamed protein product [Caenorhabditis auriculariae]